MDTPFFGFVGNQTLLLGVRSQTLKLLGISVHVLFKEIDEHAYTYPQTSQMYKYIIYTYSL